MRIGRGGAERSGASSDDIEDIENEDKEYVENLGQGQEGIKWEICDETWQNQGFDYDTQRVPFTGIRGPTKIRRFFPTFMQSFQLFWP